MVKAKAGMRMDAEGFALMQSVGDRGKPPLLRYRYSESPLRKYSPQC